MKPLFHQLVNSYALVLDKAIYQRGGGLERFSIIIVPRLAASTNCFVPSDPPEAGRLHYAIEPPPPSPTHSPLPKFEAILKGIAIALIASAK